MKFAGQFAIVALIALALTALPSGDSVLDVALTLLMIGFFVAIGLLGARLYREHQFELDSLDDRVRLVFYAGLALIFLTFTATPRLFDAGGLGILGWFALLGAGSYGLFWVWTRYRAYE